MDIQSKLRELKEMYDNGLITAAVYEEQQKAALAGGMREPPSAAETQAFTSGSSVLDPKKNLIALGRLAVLALCVSVAIWCVYTISDRDGKDSMSRFASFTGIGKQVIPWADRADTAARSLILVNKEQIANAIQGVAHPSGKDPLLRKYEVSKLGDRILAEFTVDWTGGFMGGHYSTVVVWEINKQGHVQARITFDDAMSNVAEKNKEMLDDYFRTKLFPAFYAAMGN